MAIVIIDVIIAQPHGTVGLQGDFASGSAGREGVKIILHLLFTPIAANITPRIIRALPPGVSWAKHMFIFFNR